MEHAVKPYLLRLLRLLLQLLLLPRLLLLERHLQQCEAVHNTKAVGNCLHDAFTGQVVQHVVRQLCSCATRLHLVWRRRRRRRRLRRCRMLRLIGLQLLRRPQGCRLRGIHGSPICQRLLWSVLLLVLLLLLLRVQMALGRSGPLQHSWMLGPIRLCIGRLRDCRCLRYSCVYRLQAGWLRGWQVLAGCLLLLPLQDWLLCSMRRALQSWWLQRLLLCLLLLLLLLLLRWSSASITYTASSLQGSAATPDIDA